MQFIYSGLTSGSIYALVALGFNIIYNTSGVINFAQGEFVVIGGMLLFTLFSLFNIPLPIAFLSTVIISFIIGILFERVFINSVRNKSEINLITITVAASFILRDIMMHIWGRDSLKVPSFISTESYNILGGVISVDSLIVVIVSIFLALVLNFFLKKSIYGKAMRACFDDQLAAKLSGIDVTKYRMLAFAVAAVLGAVAGALISPITYVSYNDGLMTGLKGFAAAVFGGLGSFWGALIGGYLLGIIESFASEILPSGYKNAVAFIIIILVLAFKPNGIFGKKNVERI